jgi:DNA-binding FadR family transcriptional regulator
MESCKKTLSCKGNQEEYVKADLLFHAAIVDATQNRFMAKLLGVARGLKKKPLYYLIHSDPNMQAAVDLHLDTAKAIAKSDAELAKLSMGWHFELMKKAIRNVQDQ